MTLQKSIVAEGWQTASATPISKKGSRSDPRKGRLLSPVKKKQPSISSERMCKIAEIIDKQVPRERA